MRLRFGAGRSLACLATLSLGAVASFACSSDPAAPTGPAGAPASGAVDNHCAVPSARTQVTNPASCHPVAPGDAGIPADAGAEAGDASADAPSSDNPYGPTMFNVEADDDDCKYHLKYSAGALRRGDDVTFTLTANRRSDKAPATAAAPRLEVYLNDTHPGPNTDQHATETSPGTYTVGPVRFDAAGRWTVRFHLYETCEDTLADSPHGHAAFYVDVP